MWKRRKSEQEEIVKDFYGWCLKEGEDQSAARPQFPCQLVRALYSTGAKNPLSIWHAFCISSMPAPVIAWHLAEVTDLILELRACGGHPTHQGLNLPLEFGGGLRSSWWEGWVMHRKNAGAEQNGTACSTALVLGKLQTGGVQTWDSLPLRDRRSHKSWGLWLPPTPSSEVLTVHWHH